MEERKELNISPIIENYMLSVQEELKFRWNKWSKDLTKKEVYDVIGGILSRQTSLAIQIIQNPNLWNGEIAPILLRSMADNHINLEWILIDIDNRPKEFILHGLGQLKLNLEHRKKQMEVDGMDFENDPVIEFQEKFINSQSYTFLTEVNLGSWSGLSIRKMAEQSNCVDFYNYVYQPFSGCVHSTWGHISMYNTLQSDNPLHKFLFKPEIREFEPDLTYLELAAKYVDKSFHSFDKKFKNTPKEKSSYDKLLNEIERLIEESKKNDT